MTIESIMQLVGQCAFPIVMCICMFKHMTETSKENTDSINKLCNKIDMLLDRNNKE